MPSHAERLGSRAPMRRRVHVLVALVVAVVVPGCGSSGRDVAAPEPPAPSPPPQGFPRPVPGDTLADLETGVPEGPILRPAVSLLEPGRNRLGFALFDAARTQLSGAEVALYAARPDGTGVRGPFVAHSESLKVQRRFASQSTREDPDAAKSVYVADAQFTRSGSVAVTALVRLDGRLMRTAVMPMSVGAKRTAPPGVGDRAIPIDTPTIASARGDLARIDTRVPPAPELHRENFRDVLAKKPVVIVFASPQLCPSRVCGPVVDVALQVRAAVGDDVAFVHQEVYRDNDVAKGPRPQLRKWRLSTEPWTFVIDRAGIVRARFEGALSAAELRQAVAKVQ